MKKQPKIKAVIFDMDGVIVDSMPLLYKAWSELMKEEHGVKFSRKFFYEEISGRRAPEAIEYILKKKPDKKFLKDFNKIKAKYYKKHLRKNLKETKGIIKFLQYLKKENIKIGLATSSYKKEAEYILKKVKADKYFDYMVTAEKVKKSKPEPEVFLKAAKGLKIKPENCVVVEDAPLGVMAGKKAKMTVIGLMAYHNKKILRGADFYTKDFTKKKLYKFIDAGVSYRQEPDKEKRNQ